MKMKNELLMQEIEELRRELNGGQGGEDVGMLRMELDQLRRQSEEKQAMHAVKLEEMQAELEEAQQRVSWDKAGRDREEERDGHALQIRERELLARVVLAEVL